MIVYKIQNKYCRTNDKVGVEVPTLVKQAYKINDKTGTEFLRKSIAKEMLKVTVP